VIQPKVQPQLVVNATNPIERTLYTAHPAMFRNRPLHFCVLAALVLLSGIGLLSSLDFRVRIVLIMLFGSSLWSLVRWWSRVLSTTLSVTNQRSILRSGLLSMGTTEVFHSDICNVQLRQSLLQRLFDVGYIGISSAGQAGVELEVYGIPGPNELKEQLHQLRRG
jgi:uncharacterized membrane protein YdbT with pleckstrin-like domain